ncbi:hypothetical protein TNCV_2912551 [Trichonephila clavipes]|nr:hypothetical protein TNCV_2912551 [Trichonephila clavipes]
MASEKSSTFANSTPSSTGALLGSRTHRLDPQSQRFLNFRSPVPSDDSLSRVSFHKAKGNHLEKKDGPSSACSMMDVSVSGENEGEMYGLLVSVVLAAIGCTTPLVRNVCNLKGLCYIYFLDHKALAVPYLLSLGDVTFQQDNARLLVTYCVLTYLDIESTPLLPFSY